ncbi:MAG: class IV adenylate cyclase [Phycisphaeraceae bacterium]
MTIEIEAKMRLNDSVGLIDRLLHLVGQPIAEIVESDVFLDTAEKALRSADCGLRVRHEAHLINDLPDRSRITYKGRRENGPIKRREELELGVSTADTAVLLLERLGYHVQIRFQKHRRRWRVEPCYVEIDQLPYLGRFVEIEGPSDDAVMAVREQIGLADEPLLQQPYVGMLEAYLLEHEIADRDIRLPEHHLAE